MLATAVAVFPGRRVQSFGPNSQSEARKPLREGLPVTNLVCKLAPIIKGQKRQYHPSRSCSLANIHTSAFSNRSDPVRCGARTMGKSSLPVPSSSAAPARPWPVAIVSWFVSSSSLYSTLDDGDPNQPQTQYACLCFLPTPVAASASPGGPSKLLRTRLHILSAFFLLDSF
jgi:hypothetical protein